MGREITIHAICPHCGCENIVKEPFDGDPRKMIFVNCCIEEGGCDRDYVVEYIVEIKTNAYTLQPT